MIAPADRFGTAPAFSANVRVPDKRKPPGRFRDLRFRFAFSRVAAPQQGAGLSIAHTAADRIRARHATARRMPQLAHPRQEIASAHGMPQQGHAAQTPYRSRAHVGTGIRGPMCPRVASTLI